MSNVVVVGSINMDFVYFVRSHPLPGETVHSSRTEFKAGGKGANQAVAASLSGAQVTLVGAVGRDSFSEEILEGFGHYHINTSRLLRKVGNIGTAFIIVDESGQNSIVLNGGANERLTVEDLMFLPELFEESTILLLQNEIPWPCSQHAMEAAFQHGVPIYFNPAPALAISDHIYPLIDVLILNETEAEFIWNKPLGTNYSDAASHFIQLGVKEVILTLGDKGSFYMNRQKETIYTSAYPVNAIDTTAAGDTFIGSFIAARQQGMSAAQCLLRASAASAIAVSRMGAQESIPHSEEVSAFMNDHPAAAHQEQNSLA